MKAWALVPLLAAGLLAACPDPEVVVVEVTAADHGRDLASDPSIANAAQNRLSCSDCHAETKDEASAHLPGAPLAGATLRPSYWGGQENTLLRSVNNCLYYFMAADAPWDGTEDDAVAIYAYLESLEESGDASAQPFTIGDVVDPGSGDASRGEAVYENGCAFCHGAKTTAAGRLIPYAPTLPEETLADHPDPDYDAEDRRLVFVEKIRHGGFLGYGGTMPPFSLEALSDEDLADLLTYLGVPEP
ncbi:MAG: c-type cytochrome [Polyangiaceae bacterium]|nr:c-type cytochrome [Polyangiaceae bacterium]